jgi:hypothetical protein
VLRAGEKDTRTKGAKIEEAFLELITWHTFDFLAILKDVVGIVCAG